MGILGIPAGLLGCSEPALCLTVSLFAGYPLAAIYRKYIVPKKANVHHFFFAVTGLLLMFANFGFDTVHSVISVAIAYALANYFGANLWAVIFTYAWYMVYLVIGYQYTAERTGDYDITWTMPQCVLVLRVIALIVDIYDGQQKEESLSDVQKETAVKQPPSLLEIFGFCYCFAGVLVGPQFSLRRYRSLVSGRFSDPKTGAPFDNIRACLLRAVPGLGYMLVHQALIMWLPTTYFLSDEFSNLAFMKKVMLAVVWWRIVSFKYIGAWLAVEGTCVLTGIGFNGYAENGEPLWDGVRNVRLRRYELGCSFQSIIEGYNYNTNQWAGNYVFRRLKFLGNKSASHLLTLAFLALWHGLFTGYYALFAVEYFCVTGERYILSVVERLPEKFVTQITAMPQWIIVWTVLKFFNLYGCAFGFLPFTLLRFELWWKVHKELYFSGWILYAILIPVICTALKKVLPRRGKPKSSKTE